MGDYLDSFSSVKQAIEEIQSVQILLKMGAFNITKFTTNNHVIRESLMDNDGKLKDVTLDRKYSNHGKNSWGTVGSSERYI